MRSRAAPAQHLPDRHPRRLPQDVPQRHIDRRQPPDLRPLARDVRDHLVEPPPVQLDGERVVAEQHRGGELVDVAAHGVGHVEGVAVADQPFVGMDGDEEDLRVVLDMDRLDLRDLHRPAPSLASSRMPRKLSGRRAEIQPLLETGGGHGEQRHCDAHRDHPEPPTKYPRTRYSLLATASSSARAG